MHMKIKWSVILSLLLLIGCGSEQFGSTPQSTTGSAEPVKQFAQSFCAQPTHVAPKVDILYLVDNSKSTYYLADDIKNAIRGMVNTVSQEFDYRIIGTSLLATDNTPFNDYQLLTNSQDPLSSEASSKKIISPSELSFFLTKPAESVLEAGSRRAIEFINANVSNQSGIFRQNANLLVVVFSNGRDTDIEQRAEYDGGGTLFNSTVYNERITSFNAIKNSLNLRQLRFFSVTAKSSCQAGWFDSTQSYVKIANDLYTASGATDAPSARDSYDLCGGVSNVFAPVNSSIRKVVIQNTYRYWPITFANDSNVRNDFGEIQVYKVNNGVSELIPSADWTYYEHTGTAPLNTREPSSPGGEAAGKHFIRFSNNALVVSPTCVQVKSSTRTEYFGYVVLNQEPKPESIALRINGQLIPKSDTSGWSYVGSRLNQNIKMPHPNEGDQYPAVYRSGFLLQLNGSAFYYKSGDNVDVSFIAAPI